MNTPNLDKVRNEPYPNDLQLAVMFYGDEQTCTDEELQDAEKAAEIFAAMQARIEKLEAVRKAAQSHMDFHGKPKGISKTNDDLLDALAECDE